MTKVCPNCGASNEDSFMYCKQCGTPLPQENQAPNERTCPSCGALVYPYEKFCHTCGAKLPEQTIPIQKTNQSTIHTYDAYPQLITQGGTNAPYSTPPPRKSSTLLSTSLITIFGIILFFVLYEIALQDPKNWILLLISILPGIAIILYFRYLDKRKEPWGLIIKVFLVGAFTTLIALIIELFLLGLTSLIAIFFMYNGTLLIVTWLFIILSYSYVVAGFTEELMKYWSLRTIIKDPEFDEPYDGVFYGVTGAIGFATIENILYVMQSSNPFLIGAIRGFLSVPMHAITGGLIGYYLVKNRMLNPYNKETSLLNILKIPILIHGTYDFLIFFFNSQYFEFMNGFQILLAVLLDTILLIFAFRFLKQKINLLQADNLEIEMANTIV